MKTLEHISLVFFIFSTSVFFASTSSSSSSMCNKCTVEKWNALVQARYFQTIEIEWQISAAAAPAAWGYNNNKQQLHHTSLCKVQFPLSHSDSYLFTRFSSLEKSFVSFRIFFRFNFALFSLFFSF